MEESKIKLYGAEWCSKTSMIRNYLQSRWIEFDYFDVESDEEAAEELAKANQYTMWVGDYGKTELTLREQLDKVRSQIQKSEKH